MCKVILSEKCYWIIAISLDWIAIDYDDIWWKNEKTIVWPHICCYSRFKLGSHDDDSSHRFLERENGSILQIHTNNGVEFLSFPSKYWLTIVSRSNMYIAHEHLLFQRISCLFISRSLLEREKETKRNKPRKPSGHLYLDDDKNGIQSVFWMWRSQHLFYDSIDCCSKFIIYLKKLKLTLINYPLNSQCSNGICVLEIIRVTSLTFIENLKRFL